MMVYSSLKQALTGTFFAALFLVAHLTWTIDVLQSRGVFPDIIHDVWSRRVGVNAGVGEQYVLNHLGES